MRNEILSAAVALSAPFLFAACAADSNAPDAEAEDVESTDEALAASARKVTTHYEGTFVDSGETFTVGLDVEMTTAAVGYQKMDSARWKQETPHCRVYNEWTPATVKLRVTGRGGRVVAERTQATGTSGFEQLDRSECPSGQLLNARAFAKLDAEISEQGTEFESDGRKVHVPRGYFSPGFFYVKGSSSFRALSAGKVEHESETGGYTRSDWEIPRGIIRVSLPSETTISVGIGPSMQASLGYEKIVDVTLRAR